jgi:NADH pyrophosphatase NudC (nudix superfamily)
VHYGNPTPVVAAIVEHPDGVLLARNKGWPDGMFGLVTGYLEAGETPEAGVLREVQEELGLAAEIVSLVAVHAFELKNELLVTYHVRAEGEVQLGDELAAYKVVPEAKLRPWPVGTGHAVRDWLRGRGREDV